MGCIFHKWGGARECVPVRVELQKVCQAGLRYQRVRVGLAKCEIFHCGTSRTDVFGAKVFFDSKMRKLNISCCRSQRISAWHKIESYLQIR